MRKVAPRRRGHRGGVRRARPAVVRSALSHRLAGARLLALLPPGAPSGTVRLGMAGTRTQHLRIRHAAARPTRQHRHLPGQRRLGFHRLVVDSRQPLRRRVEDDRDTAGVVRLRRAARVHGLHRLRSRPLRPPRHPARRRSHARERLGVRARHVGIDAPPVPRGAGGRGRRVGLAGGAVPGGRLALGRRSRPAAGGGGVGDRQRLLRAVAVVVRRRAGRSGRSAPGQACSLQSAAVPGRAGHRRGAEPFRPPGGGGPGRHCAGAPPRPLSLRRRVLWRDAVGRRRLPCRATGADGPGAARAGRAATADVHALRGRAGKRRRVLDEHGVGVERDTNRQPFDVLGLETDGRSLSPPDLVPRPPRVLHAVGAARRHVGRGPVRLRRRDPPAGLLVRRFPLRVRSRAGSVGAGARVREPLEPAPATSAPSFPHRVHALCVGASPADCGGRGRSRRPAAFLHRDPPRLCGARPDGSPGLEAELLS